MPDMTSDAFTQCPDPECGAPAILVDRFTLRSTDGPFMMSKIQCVTGHWFTVPDRASAAPANRVAHRDRGQARSNA